MFPSLHIILYAAVFNKIFCQSSGTFNNSVPLDPLEESIVSSILRVVDEKFESISTRMSSLERGLNSLQYYNLRQFRVVNTHLHTLNTLLQTMHSQVTQQNVNGKEIASSIVLLKREVKNMELRNSDAFEVVENKIITVQKDLSKQVGHVQETINALNDSGSNEDDTAKILNEIVVTERSRTEQICSETFSKVEAKLDALHNSTMNAIANITVTIPQSKEEGNQTARRMFEESLSEMNENVLQSINFYRHTGDLVERIVGATESVAEDQTKLREDIKYYMELHSNYTESDIPVKKEENNDKDILVSTKEEKCDISAEIMDEIQNIYKNGSQILDLIADMTRSAQTDLKTTIQQLNNEVFKLQDTGRENDKSTSHPEVLSGLLDFNMEELSNTSKAVFHIVEAIASNTGWIPYIFSNLQYLENQVNLTLLTSKKVLKQTQLQNTIDQKAQNRIEKIISARLQDDPNIHVNPPRNQDMKETQVIQEHSHISSSIMEQKETKEILEKLDFMFKTNKKVRRIIPALTRLLGEPEPFISLVDGNSESEGRVEIFKKGKWGTLCGAVTHIEASYICRYLGYLGGIATKPGHFGPGIGIFWDMNFTCLLSRQCPVAKPVIDQTSCDHARDHGIICDHMIRLWFEAKDDEPIKRNVGYLEMYHGEEWIPVCPDNWTDTNTLVVCHQLGYKNGLVHDPDNSTLPYHMESAVMYHNVTCLGNEYRLDACQNGVWVKDGCTAKKPVHMTCT